MIEENNDALLDVRAFGRKIGKAPVTIDRWARDGLAPHSIRIGNKRYWRESAINHWLDELQARTEA